MSQPLSAAGYQRIRDLLQADTAIYLELLDAADAPIIRLPISDARLSWAHEAGAQTMILRAVVTGADGDIPLGTVIKSTAVYGQAEGGSSLTGAPQPVGYYDAEGDFHAATGSILAPVDEVTCDHEIEVPEVVA